MTLSEQSNSDARLVVVPLNRDDANAYVERHHRHAAPVVGHRFAIGAARRDQLVGVAIIGRPTARALQDGWTVEVVRLCTTGERNVCSFLYRAAWRAARAQGFRRLVTYTLRSESGASLRGAGLKVVGELQPREWDCPSRPRDPGDPQERLRWELAV
jgi:hypothetical protein